METGPNILILETETGQGALLLEDLREREVPLGTVSIHSPERLPQALDAHPPDIILAEYAKLSAESFSLIEHLRASRPKIPVVVITTSCDPGQLVELFECGAANHVRRHQIAELGPVIRFALENPHPLLLEPEQEVVCETLLVRPSPNHPRRSCVSHSVRRICERCGRIADTSGEWERLNVYLRLYQEATVTLGVCPNCAQDKATTFRSSQR